MLIGEVLSRLSQPIPPTSIAIKTIKGKSISYVSWYELCNLLDDRARHGNWEWGISHLIFSPDERLILIGTLTLHGDDKTISFQATGQEELNCSSYGDPSSNAESMAFRRCCAKAGLGRQLWVKQQQTNGQKYSTTRPVNFQIT